MARTSSLLRRVGYAVGEQDADRERSLELFEALIREARQDEKGRGRIGAMFLDEAARTIHLLVAAYRLDPPVTHDLARVFARAGVKAPPALVQCLIGQMDELIQAGGLPFDPNAEIERLSVALELDEHYLHRKLDERIGVLPEELRAASCPLPKTLSTSCNTDPRRCPRGGTRRRCSPRRAGPTPRSGSSPQPYTACVSCAEYPEPFSPPGRSCSLISVSSSFPSVTTMSQKSSVMQLPQFVPKALTSDTL